MIFYDIVFSLLMIFMLLNSIVWLTVGAMLVRLLWEYFKHQESMHAYVERFKKYFPWT